MLHIQFIWHSSALWLRENWKRRREGTNRVPPYQIIGRKANWEKVSMEILSASLPYSHTHLLPPTPSLSLVDALNSSLTTIPFNGQTGDDSRAHTQIHFFSAQSCAFQCQHALTKRACYTSNFWQASHPYLTLLVSGRRHGSKLHRLCLQPG